MTYLILFVWLKLYIRIYIVFKQQILRVEVYFFIQNKKRTKVSSLKIVFRIIMTYLILFVWLKLYTHIYIIFK